MSDEDNVVQLDPARAKMQHRYDELKALQPKPPTDEWKEFMTLGRKLSTKKTKTAERDEAKQEKLKQLYPRALEVIEKQLADYLADHIIVCPECDHAIRTHRGKAPGDALKAAMRVVDQIEGKAAQTIRTEETTVHEIRYVTSAAPAEDTA